MSTILLILSVLCDGQTVPHKAYAETTQKRFEHDVQLVRTGWYNYTTGGRCKAARVKYTKENKYE